VSCIRRIAAVRVGTKSRIENMFSIILPEIKISAIEPIKLASQVKRMKYQNSRRVATPAVINDLLRVAILISINLCIAGV